MTEIVLLAFCWLWLSVPAFGISDEIVVKLLQARVPVSSVVLEGPFFVRRPFQQTFPRGLYQVRAKSGRLLLSVNQRPLHSLISGELVLTGTSGVGLGVGSDKSSMRHYRGVIQIAPVRGCLSIRSQVNARAYVTSVVGSETHPQWPLEALKAQAVLTQTRMARYKPGDELGDTTEKEAYLGADYERSLVRTAVQSVWGQLLKYDGSTVQPFYHSTCAGKTSSVEGFFTDNSPAIPYLVSVSCAYCKKSPFWKVKRSVIPSSVFAEVSGKGIPSITKYDTAHRSLLVRLADGRTMTGYQFWLLMGKKIGWDKAPGTRYSFKQQSPSSVVLESNGAGHGVGMCQWGAAELAQRGWSYREILQYYFPGAKVDSR